MSLATSIPWSDPARRAAFEAWLAPLAAAQRLDAASLRAASADASFRRYFRIDAADGTRVVMDAPPAQEDSAAFVRVAALLRAGGLRAPQVFDWHEAQGFMLLEDLGERTLLDAVQGLDATAAAPRYRAALESLVRLQVLDAGDAAPAYDAAMLDRELELFPAWYAERHCALALSDTERAGFDRCKRLIVDACLAQPAVLVHRDYHARNLMAGDDPQAPPGVLDFQGAVRGPITYDVVSLLRDAYIEWDEETQLDWAIRWWEQARRAKLPVDADFGRVWRDFEWTGLQRHLKVLGIFARLAHRDGKPGYLADLPRVWRHAHKVATRYQGLGALALLLEKLAGTQRASGYTF
ncbi:MAG TPA: phosphotransferase [Methylibium sp.]|uniref:aminoglycoside phosphotransferase family protein n=1 Tax=Methylibium sp. TaxID=2067992 RepID=UPI002DB8A952|nr:phosphotransferase [Methylibium sp.]HEU4460394.1 phosphotransferase [Methylibium sp.]